MYGQYPFSEQRQQKAKVKVKGTNPTWSQSFLIMCVCVLSRVWLCHPKYCSLPGSSVHRISQARILEQVAISFFRGSGIPTQGVNPRLSSLLHWQAGSSPLPPPERPFLVIQGHRATLRWLKTELHTSKRKSWDRSVSGKGQNRKTHRTCIITRSKYKVSTVLALSSELLVETFLALASVSLAETVLVVCPGWETVWEWQTQRTLIWAGIERSRVHSLTWLPARARKEGGHPEPAVPSLVFFLLLKQGKSCDWSYVEVRRGTFNLAWEFSSPSQLNTIAGL